MEHHGESPRPADRGGRADMHDARFTTAWSSALQSSVRRSATALALAAACAFPIAAFAGTMVAASTIPDGTYTVKVERIVDPKHVVVSMDNGNETTLGAGRDTIDFSKVRQDDQLKVSLIGGSVMVYADLTAHT